MSAPAPIEPEQLTRVGFGCYRVDVRSAVHAAALERALLAGCNLIDTASSYSDGRSEELVGSVLERTGARAFVVTKIGHVSPAAAHALAIAGVSVDGLPRLEGGTPFSLEPTVLRTQIDLSRERLRRPVLDAVLLHNPERLMDTGASTDQLRVALDRALAMLADEVAAGRLRFYGVSSNVLPSAPPGDPLDLETILEVGSSHGGGAPGLVQFPLNLIEREATHDGERPSLLERASGTRTMSNRPMNAIVDGDIVRLVGRSIPKIKFDPWHRCVELVAARLAALGDEHPWTSFSPMQFLRDNRDEMLDPELLDAVWVDRIDPFIETLFDGEPPREAREAFTQLHEYAKARTLATAHDRERAAFAHLVEKGLIDPTSHDPLPVIACRYCLDAGVDHVLVGMRRPEYVDQVAPLFT